MPIFNSVHFLSLPLIQFVRSTWLSPLEVSANPGTNIATTLNSNHQSHDQFRLEREINWINYNNNYSHNNNINWTTVSSNNNLTLPTGVWSQSLTMAKTMDSFVNGCQQHASSMATTMDIVGEEMLNMPVEGKEYTSKRIHSHTNAMAPHKNPFFSLKNESNPNHFIRLHMLHSWLYKNLPAHASTTYKTINHGKINQKELPKSWIRDLFGIVSSLKLLLHFLFCVAQAIVLNTSRNHFRCDFR